MHGRVRIGRCQTRRHRSPHPPGSVPHVVLPDHQHRPTGGEKSLVSVVVSSPVGPAGVETLAVDLDDERPANRQVVDPSDQASVVEQLDLSAERMSMQGDHLFEPGFEAALRRKVIGRTNAEKFAEHDDAGLSMASHAIGHRMDPPTVDESHSPRVIEHWRHPSHDGKKRLHLGEAGVPKAGGLPLARRSCCEAEDDAFSTSDGDAVMVGDIVFAEVDQSVHSTQRTGNTVADTRHLHHGIRIPAESVPPCSRRVPQDRRERVEYRTDELRTERPRSHPVANHAGREVLDLGMPIDASPIARRQPIEKLTFREQPVLMMEQFDCDGWKHDDPDIRWEISSSLPARTRRRWSEPRRPAAEQPEIDEIPPNHSIFVALLPIIGARATKIGAGRLFPGQGRWAMHSISTLAPRARSTPPMVMRAGGVASKNSP